MTETVLKITSDHEAVLIALARFHYLTATQVSRLLHPGVNDEDRWSQRHLKKLVDAGYVLRLRALPPKPTGQPPHVFTLARKGRRVMNSLGIPVEAYFRPSEESKAALDTPFMQHTLAAIDVLISATCLCRDHDVTSPNMMSERQLKRGALRVEVPPGPRANGERAKVVAVIPDGWFQLQVGEGTVISIALELDRGTEAQRAWRDKVAALALWASGPYMQAFETTNLTIIVVCPDAKRRDNLAHWTHAELADRQMGNLADIFLFTSVNPVEVTPAALFFGRCWRSAESTDRLSVLDPPVESEVTTIQV